jgi:subtilisin family serine protease
MKHFLLPVLLFLLCILSSPVRAQGVNIDPRVLADTADGKVGRFLVVMKSQTQTRALVASIADRAARGRLVFDALRRNADATQSNVRAQLNALNVKHRAYWIVNVIAVEGKRDVVDALAARADVLAIESDREFRVPLEPSASVPAAPNAVEWNVSKIGAPVVWNAGFTGQGIVYANADTGVQWDHPALISHYRGWDGATADHNYNWWDAIHSGNNPCNSNNPSIPLPASGSPAPCDPYGHGTHTLGIGIGDDGAGNQVGVAPGAKWISCRNMNSLGYGTPSTYLECFQFFLAPTDLNGNNPDPTKRPDVVGNSYGCPPSEGCAANSLLVAMDNLRAAGIFMAVSAGNAGPSCSSIDDPPAIYDSAITIGATDSNDAIAAFSSRGSVTIDGSNRRKPDLVAPGVSVRSSMPGNSYGSSYGTSMAAPHVAGAVALLWSAFPALRGNVDATETLLEQTAVRLATSQTCGGDAAFQYPNNVFGYGRIDVWAAYDYQSPPLGFKYRFPMISHNP